MKIAASPTVFIGLGGTGTEILRKLRERLEQRVGTADLPFFRFLYLDTHKGSAEGAVAGLKGAAAGWSRALAIEPSPEVLERLQSPNRDGGALAGRLALDKWFDQALKAYLSPVNFAQGVGGKRMLSRLGFLASSHLSTLEGLLKTFHEELAGAGKLAGKPLVGLEPSALEIVPTRIEAGVRFVVLASGGGGTGSGSFLEMGFLLRRLIRAQGWTVDTHGYAALARSGVSAPLEVSNTAALLTELDHYDGTMGYDYHYLSDPPGQRSNPAMDPPFDRVFLTMPCQQERPLDGDRARAFSLLQWRLAEHLLHETLAVFAPGTQDEKVKLPVSGSRGSVAWRRDASSSNPPGFFTLGVGAREWPAARVATHLLHRLAGALAERALAGDPGEVAGAVERLGQELGIGPLEVRANRAARPASQDRLLQALLAPLAGFDPARQLQGCRERGYDERGRLKPGGLQEVGNGIQQQLSAREGLPAAGQPGAVFAVLEQNARRLEGSEGLPRRVAEELLQLCERVGPAASREAARQLEEALVQELALLEDALAGLSPRLPDPPERIEDLWRYANEALIQAALERKRRIYGALQGWLGKLRGRFEHFTRYLEGYARERGPARLPGGECPALVMPPAEIERLEQALLAGLEGDLGRLRQPTQDRQGRSRQGLLAQLDELIQRGLPERDEEGRPTLFCEGPPRREGAVDLSPLAAFELEAAQALQRAQGKASPSQVGVLELLLEESRRSGEPFPSLLEEARPLIHLRLGDQAWKDLPFSKAGLHRSLRVQAEQQGYPELKAQEAAGGAWISGWGPEVQSHDVHREDTDGLSPWSVSYVIEACSIQTHLLNGYDAETRRDHLQARAGQPGWFTSLSDTRVRPVPSPADQAQALALLLGSLAMNLWQFLDPERGWRFNYERQDPSGVPLREAYTAQTDMPAAVRALCHEPRVQKALREAVWARTDTHKGEAVERIRGALDEFNNERLKAPKGGRGDVLTRNLLNVDFGAAVEALTRFAQEFQIPLESLQHPYAVARKAGEPATWRDGEVQQDGYYCRGCGHLFGVSMPGREGVCPSCRYPEVQTPAPAGT